MPNNALHLTNPRAKMQHLIKRVGADPQRRYTAIINNYNLVKLFNG